MSNRDRGHRSTVADDHPDLIAATRERLVAAGIHYVIENVPGARAELVDPVVLNGPPCGLPRIDRPRLFETNWSLIVPRRARAENAIGVYGKRPDGRRLWKRADGTEQRAARSLDEAREVMGMPWAREWREVAEAIPPAYTELIGTQLLAIVAPAQRDGGVPA